MLVLLSVIFGSVGLTVQAMVWTADETKTLDRNLEPVIIQGADVISLLGAPVESLFVYTYQGTTWGDQIPIQVDEVTVGGYYTSTEDGLLDDNDEIVFMAQDLGDRATDTSWLEKTLSISDTWYEIEVADPLNPTQKGWAYLVRSDDLPVSFSDDYVDYTAAVQQITASQYRLGFADTHPGVDYLTMNGNSTDILDLTKLRVILDLGWLGVVTVTEQILPNPGLTVIKDGPIRVVLHQNITYNDYPFVNLNLGNTYIAYAGMFQSISDVDFELGNSTTLSSIRTSVDFDSVISGTATYYNANTPGGVNIDGNPDPVAELPLSKWGQVNHPTGRLIQVIDPALIGGTEQKNFFRDNHLPEEEDTGQAGSYGETGILFQGNVNPIFTLNDSLFILLPGSENEGPTYEAYFFNPLLVGVNFQGAVSTSPMFLPIIFKST